MVTNLERIELFLLADMIDDILLAKDHKREEKILYSMISKSVKRLTNIYGKNTDLSLEFDAYKNKAHTLIEELMRSSME